MYVLECGVDNLLLLKRLKISGENVSCISPDISRADKWIQFVPIALQVLRETLIKTRPSRAVYYIGRARVCFSNDNAITTLTYVHTRSLALSHVFRICLIDTQYRARVSSLSPAPPAGSLAALFMEPQGVRSWISAPWFRAARTFAPSRWQTETRYFFSLAGKQSARLWSDLGKKASTALRAAGRELKFMRRHGLFCLRWHFCAACMPRGGFSHPSRRRSKQQSRCVRCEELNFFCRENYLGPLFNTHSRQRFEIWYFFVDKI